MIGPSQRSARVFCNRSLRLDQVELIGFDMDFTLAAYDSRAMHEVSCELTLRRMVERGYPPLLGRLDCPPDFAVRGLVVDINRGNVLQMDRYRYVKTAYHGLQRLSREQRRELYERRPEPGSYRYRWIDTLYSLPDVTVYAAAIDALERDGVEVDPVKLWDDVRSCADEAHGSGEVYSHIEAEPRRFLEPDPKLAATLHMLRSAGKRLFLLTNSPPASTELIMGLLLDTARPEYPTWRHYFDIAISEARKPRWFDGDRPLVDTAEPDAPVTTFRRDRLYTGGNRAQFEALAGVSGPDVLYVGDHIYGDVLRANVESGWRTMMICQEMDLELAALHRHGADLDRIDALDHEARSLADQLRAVRDGSALASSTELIERLLGVQDDRDALEAKVDAAFHPYWGSVFSAGTELSSFAAQVEQYAWLYTTRVSNLGGYSPGHQFRSPRSRMPHER